MNELDTRFVILSVLASVAIVYTIQRTNKTAYPLPPSPKGYPLIGNLFSIPTEEQHVGFVEIGKRLNSDIFCLQSFGTTIIVLNSLEDATSLLEKRSSIYSDRVCPPMVAEPSLLNWSGFIALLKYDERWKKSRKMIHPWLNKKAVEEFHQAHQVQARQLLQRLLKVSDHLRTSDVVDAELYQTFASTLAHSIYGYKVDSVDDPFVKNFRIATDNLAEASLPSNFLVNLFPALVNVPDWMPGAGWKHTARAWREQQEHAVDSWYNWTKSKIASRESDSSIIHSLLTQAEELGIAKNEIDDYVKQIAITLIIGGTDTSSSALLVFFLAMVRFPEIQAKAQNEIDELVGSKRLPTMEDRPKLRYLDRLLNEVLRWRPPVPNALPHACSENDMYKGYFIPKGSIVIGNTWAINHDPTIYKDPEVFNPDRFLDPDLPIPPTFGFGRRLCPGIHYARSTLFILAASILATFDITGSDNPNQPGEPRLGKEPAKITYRPELFGLKLTPRSDQAKELIRADPST